jgi:hypothetical protein
MRNLLIGAVAALLLVAGPARAEQFTAVATLGGGEETPAALLTGAVGTAEVTIDTDTKEFTVTLKIYNIPTGTTAGHIHVGPKGVSGPVVLNFPIPAGRSGDLTLDFRAGRSAFVARPEIGILTIDDLIQAVAFGGAYVNVHTTQFPGGEIRGQLTVRQ